MSHLPSKQDQAKFIGNLYGLRTWIEYGFKQCKNELGWADYRLTHYEQIERWWEMVSSVYLMVSLQFYGLGAQPPGILDEGQRDLLTRLEQHPDWQEAKGWKRRFNNVQLLVQPFIFFCLLQPWMRLFDISTLERGFAKLIRIIMPFQVGHRWLLPLLCNIFLLPRVMNEGYYAENCSGYLSYRGD
ncbi:hypothetical protein NDA01_30650 [Trichocoleus desertorum AS-A10]|uniref:hypothetical protein n=1 Tax=Trichocoleus desertorum TaxID=1481672 RepID=UPI0032992F9E